jgi:ubiquinone/menaquinone biosynthesis C-methylase UbiE
MVRRVEQVHTFEAQTAAQAWRRATATRTEVLAAATERMLKFARVAQENRILVIGAGTGDEALDAVAKVGPGGEVIATDASAAMVEEMGRKFARAEVRNVHCLLMDAQHLNFDAQSFDAVIARNVLQFVPDLHHCLLEIRRVLKPGKRLGASVWSAASRNPFRSGPLDAARALGIRPSPGVHLRVAMRLGVPSRLSRELQAAGFSDVVVERVEATARYESVSMAVEEVMDHPGTRQLVAMLPDASAKRMANSLTRRWRRFSSADATVIPGEQLVAAGTR